MKRLQRTILMALLPCSLLGQVPPAWVQEAYRECNYPATEWYTGFVRDNLKAGADAGLALKELERYAQNQLVESMIITIEGNTKVETGSYSLQKGKKQSEQITTDYRQMIQTSTTATLVKSDVKSYHDPVTGTIYALAVVRRTDLTAFYHRQLNTELNKVEIALSMSEQLVEAGKKMSAFRQCSDAQTILEGIAYYQYLSTAINAQVSDEDLQTVRSRQLQQSLNQILINLEQSTLIYVNCKYESKGMSHDAFGSDPGIICGIIKQSLSENNCSVTDNQDEADYELTLTASTTQRSDGTGQYGIITYYANVKGILYNRLTKKKTADFAILNDTEVYAEGKTAEIAATRAFKLPALKDKILGSILPKIKN